MKVLVTGASGYLGGRLCRALLNRGFSVRALVRPTSDLSSLPHDPSALVLVHGDITDYQSLLEACSGCHIVFHAAALVEPWLPDPSKFISVNVRGLKNVLQAASETKTIEKIIYTSSFFALGSTDGYVADEKQVHHEKFFCTEYERSKAIADKIALQAASEGIPIVPVYPGVIYGSGKLTAGNVIARMLIERFNWRLPGYLGQGNDKYSFSHVDDVVEGHIAAMQKGRVGERYLLTGENASFVDVFDIAAAITGTRRPIFNIPLWLIEAYGWVSVFISRITGKLPLISPPKPRIWNSNLAADGPNIFLRPDKCLGCCKWHKSRVTGDARKCQYRNRIPNLGPRTVYVLRHQWAYSCDKAKQELGYNPRSLKEGLEEMLPWLKSLGLIKY